MNALWVEKYRPSSFTEMALTDDDRTLLNKYVEDEEIPHLLFAGSPGTGKTTTAKILIGKLDCQSLVLNASDERGIDTIRNKVGTFARTRTYHKWNIVFLDEADYLTPEAQNSLRNMIETYASVARFILTCNYLHKITPALRSRTTLIEMTTIPVKERFRILFQILNKEGVDAPPAVVHTYAQKYPDLRRMISAAQKCVLSRGTLEVAQKHQMGGLEFLALIKQENWKGLREAASAGGFDPQTALRDMFWAVDDNTPQAAEWRLRIGRALRDSQTAPDPIIDFLACGAELMTLV